MSDTLKLMLTIVQTVRETLKTFLRPIFCKLSKGADRDLTAPSSLWPCSHCRSCAGTVPICRISGVCERAMSAIKLDLISGNLIRSREGSVFRHNYLCRNKCNVNAAYTYVGERWRCRVDIINVVLVNGSQSNYL